MFCVLLSSHCPDTTFQSSFISKTALSKTLSIFLISLLECKKVILMLQKYIIAEALDIVISVAPVDGYF